MRVGGGGGRIAVLEGPGMHAMVTSWFGCTLCIIVLSFRPTACCLKQRKWSESGARKQRHVPEHWNNNLFTLESSSKCERSLGRVHTTHMLSSLSLSLSLSCAYDNIQSPWLRLWTDCSFTDTSNVRFSRVLVSGTWQPKKRKIAGRYRYHCVNCTFSNPHRSMMETIVSKVTWLISID